MNSVPKQDKKKVLMAMSGGLDSSMTAVLLKEKNYELIGITLRVYQSQFRSDPMEQSINDAKILADKLDIPYYVIDVSKDFKTKIIDYFINEYYNGHTPNPCALCNFTIKWEYLIRLADEFGCNYIATGHYAKIKQKNGRLYISEGQDFNKDQSYFLWRLNQDFLKRTLFPLGNFNKKQIRELAELKGFKDIATKRESYDICFIPEGDYRDFLKKNSRSPQPGKIVNTKNQVLGTHQGIIYYTHGQRKGLGIAYTEPLYVVDINPEENKITLGTKQELYKNVIYLKDFVLSKYDPIPKNKTFQTKIRYRSKPLDSKVSIENNLLKIEFETPATAPSPGQSAVIYEENDLVAGGVIV